MRILIFLVLTLYIISCTSTDSETRKLATKIMADQTMVKVDAMARELIAKGFYAGTGYQMVWSRDLNTFIEISCEVYDVEVIRENLIMFFHFQQENGEMLDGYVEKEAFTWGDPHPYYSVTASGHVGFKNTVETDQETSLIQTIAKYIAKTGDNSILHEVVDGMSVYERLVFSIDYLLAERYSQEHGLIIGATTFDWGDVQVEGGAVVDVDELTHWSIDVYDNAMLAIALLAMQEFAQTQEDKMQWKNLHADIMSNIRKHLWDAQKNKFIPHVYIDGSPFPDEFDENAIHYHGGTAVAIEAGVLTREEIAIVSAQMAENVKLSGAQSIGLTLYPAYPEEVLGAGISKPYQYQNGGDWTWFGGRMIQQLIAWGFVQEAYDLSQPMLDRVVKNGDFYEWYTIDGTPSGSAGFKGSAGVLAKSISMFYEWAQKNS